MAALILFDTDVLIDHLRGHSDAQAELLATPADQRAISAISAMVRATGVSRLRSRLSSVLRSPRSSR